MKRYFDHFLDVPIASISRRCYTDDFKRQAIALAQAARQLEMSSKTLASWARRGPLARSVRHAQTDQ